MRASMLSLMLAAGLATTVLTAAPEPAEARSGRFVAGLLVGAVVSGIVAREVYRHKRRHHVYGYRYVPYGYRYSYVPSYRYHAYRHW